MENNGSTSKEKTDLVPPVQFNLTPDTNFCKYCKEGYSEICSLHKCDICFQRVGGRNALTCKKCKKSFHLACLPSPLTDPFEFIWYCSRCPSDNPNKFGRGYQLGKIPGVLVGTSWRYRKQVADANIHRPSMAGIHGSGGVPAYSIVLNGGYEGDEDQGEDIFYTGSGGQDPQMKELIADQIMSGSNLALAASCDAPINLKGATAFDWAKSSSIRVIRGYGLSKFNSKYAPTIGFRYDGIYKLYRYWPEIAKSGFRIWRFHFRRYDSEPPPWTEEGRNYIKLNNLIFQDSEKIVRGPNKSSNQSEESNSSKLLKSTNDTHKYKMERSINRDGVKLFESYQRKDHIKIPYPTLPKSKFNLNEMEPIPAGSYSHPFNFLALPNLKKFTIKDKLNQSFWSKIHSTDYLSIRDFLDDLKIKLTCPICSKFIDPTYPFTTPCSHNFCGPCFSDKVPHLPGPCPTCKVKIKGDLEKSTKRKEKGFAHYSSDDSSLHNKVLSSILHILMPVIKNDS